MKSDIYIIGSSNTDMVIKSNSIPKPGETIIGGDFYSFQGGKGANQAVAASKLGGKVIFICKVGDSMTTKPDVVFAPILEFLNVHPVNTQLQYALSKRFPLASEHFENLMFLGASPQIRHHA